MDGVDGRGFSKKQAVLGHGVIDARAGQDEAVVATEGGDHDGGGHQLDRQRTEDLGCRSGGDAILGSVLDGFERQYVQVNEIAAYIEKRRSEEPSCRERV